MSLVSTAYAVDIPRPCSDADLSNAFPSAQRGELDIDLALRHAGPRRVRLRYELVGDARLPAVLVAGGISAHRHLAANAADASKGWWEAQVGPGRAIDPARLRVLSLDWIGAGGALDAPIDPADQADAIAALLDHLRIQCLHAFIGSSYGAMVGLQFASRHAARVGRLVAISGVHRAHPYSSAWRALQRRAVQLGALQCDGVDGLVLARQLALLSYRTPGEFDERFGAARVVDGRVHVPAEDYLDHAAQAWAANTPVTAFLRLSESIDLQRVEPGSIAAPVTLVAVEEDRLVPLADAYALAQGLRGETRVRVLRSRYGHDAFLKETDAIARVLAEALDAEVAA
jgi:homoserine O-acetyltransferase